MPRTVSNYSVSFAAGGLICVSLMRIIPEFFELSASGLVFLLVGFLVICVPKRSVRRCVCHEYE